MTNVIPVSAGLGMAVITWKLSPYNYPRSSAWGWESDVEDTFAVGNTPLRAGFAHVCPAQPGKPCSWMCLLPIQISRKEHFLLLQTAVGCCSTEDSFEYSQPSLHWMISHWYCSGSAEAPCHHAKSTLTEKPHSLCGFTRFLDRSSNLFSCFGKNGTEGNTAVLSWRSTLEANFSCSLMCKGEEV